MWLFRVPPAHLHVECHGHLLRLGSPLLLDLGSGPHFLAVLAVVAVRSPLLFFFFFGAFSCRLLPPSPFFFFGASFSLCASLLAVVSLSNSTASLFRLVEFNPLPSFFFLVFLVSLLWVYGRPCATATEKKMGTECATCGCTRHEPTCTRCTPLAQDLHTLIVRRTTHMHMSKHIAVQLATR